MRHPRNICYDDAAMNLAFNHRIPQTFNEETAPGEFRLNDCGQVVHTNLTRRRQSLLLYEVVKPNTFGNHFTRKW